MKKMDESLRAHYGKVEPRQAFVERMLHDGSENVPEIDTKYVAQSRSFFRVLAGVAALIVGCLLVLMWHEPSDAIQIEVAEQHIKAKAPQFFSNEFARLDEKMTDFLIREPTPGPLASLELIGGRPCSIQKIPAAQLLLKDKEGVRYTLYQAPVVEILDVSSSVKQVGALQIRTWQENGLLYVLAGPPS